MQKDEQWNEISLKPLSLHSPFRLNKKCEIRKFDENIKLFE